MSAKKRKPRKLPADPTLQPITTTHVPQHVIDAIRHQHGLPSLPKVKVNPTEQEAIDRLRRAAKLVGTSPPPIGFDPAVFNERFRAHGAAIGDDAVDAFLATWKANATLDYQQFEREARAAAERALRDQQERALRDQKILFDPGIGEEVDAATHARIDAAIGARLAAVDKVLQHFATEKDQPRLVELRDEGEGSIFAVEVRKAKPPHDLIATIMRDGDKWSTQWQIFWETEPGTIDTRALPPAEFARRMVARRARTNAPTNEDEPPAVVIRQRLFSYARGIAMREQQPVIFVSNPRVAAGRTANLRCVTDMAGITRALREQPHTVAIVVDPSAEPLPLFKAAVNVYGWRDGKVTMTRDLG